MSLILAGLIVAGTSGAVAVGRWLFRRRDDERTPDPVTSGDAASPAKATAAPVAAKRTAEGQWAHLEGFPCQLGDVVTRLTGEEAWLAGAVVLREAAPVAALFVAPEAGQDYAIYVRPRPRESLYWMTPLDPGAVLVLGEPPSSVEHGGIRFDRVRRLPLRPKRMGVGAPELGDTVIVAEYASAGAERLVVMRGNTGSVSAYRGEELEPSSYEVIASGRGTLAD